MPKKIPTKSANPKLAAILKLLMTVVKPPNFEMSCAATTPIKIPIMPPITLIIVDSIKNCSMMFEYVAPIALRIPISRVRSVTDAKVMFMISEQKSYHRR